MSNLSSLDILKLTFKVLKYKFDQRKLTTNINVEVTTPLGDVKGVKRLSSWGDFYYSFEKIPFAKPPLGELRFKAPVPISPWQGTLDCTGPATAPMQMSAFIWKYKGTEDCLYLNVYTPNLQPGKLLPVLVWIYGGGYQVGEASRDFYSPEFFMSKEVVIVTTAYRLGPFGFLSLDDPELDIPGNAGIKDQIMSLRWIHENIASFGGDPNNVTMFGESAGAAGTHLCMLSEQSRGLIHKAIMMSGSALCPFSRPQNNKGAYRLAKCLGYNDEENDAKILQFLQKFDGPAIVKVISSVLNKNEKHHRIFTAFGPVVEPYLTDHCIVPQNPYEMMKTTWSNEIPLMLGATSFEGLLFFLEVTRRPETLLEVKNCKNLVPIDLNLDPTSDQLVQYGLQLKKAYFGDDECSPKTIYKFLELESHREFWHPIYRTVLSRQQHARAPTYLYRFDFDSKIGNYYRNLLCGPGVRGVCHGDDMCYLFKSMIGNRFEKDSPEEQMACTMVDIWTTFAECGDPNCKSMAGVKFEPVEAGKNPKCLNISQQISFIELPELERMLLWSSFYPQGKL